jgi:hypothetical protein
MCDTLVALPAATAGGATLFAKNSDRPPDEVQVVVWSPPRRDPGPLRVTHIEVEPTSSDTFGCLLSKPTWCWGAEHGVNEVGVAIGNEAIYTTLDPRSAPAALTGLDLVRLGLERAADAAAAVAVITGLLERYGQGGTGHDPAGRTGTKAYWNSFLVADPHVAYVIETSGREYAVEQVEPGGVRAISNRTTIDAFDAQHRHPRQPVERLVDPRWHASQRVLAQRPVTRDSLMAHLRSHDSCVEPGWSVCMHGCDAGGALVEVTTASMVAELSAVGAPRVWWLVGAPCEVDYVEQVVSATGR